VNDIDVSQPEIAKKIHSVNREPVYDFLLVINSNLTRTVTEIQRLIGQKSQILLTPSHLAPSIGMTPFEFMEKLCGS